MRKEKFYKCLRENRLPLELLFAYVLLHNFFEHYINLLIVSPVLSEVESGWVNDVLFGILLIIIIFNFCRRIKKNYKVTSKTFLLYLCTLIVYAYYRFYLYYRFNAKVWDFTEFDYLGAVKYLDIVALYALGNIILFSKKGKKKKEQKQKEQDQKEQEQHKQGTEEYHGFFLDTPLGKDDPDLLNRNNLAEYICHQIKATNSQKSSFAIGISSEWGFGKTSFLNLIEGNLDQETNIIIKFNPWISQESKSIVKDFFNELSTKLSEYNSDISPLLKNYASLLVGLGSNPLNQVLNPILKNYTQNSTASSEFKRIDDAINNLDKKLIIFIDDLDRLNKEEIIQVLKLIRNSANFGNTFFIVAYDRNYVTNAIKDINNYNSEFFLEKIFQLEFSLPNFENDIIRKRICELLSPSLIDSDKTELLDIVLNRRRSQRIEILNFSSHKEGSYISQVFNSKAITTIRDATRFSNSFLVAYKYLKGEIVLSDLLNVEVLRLKYPGVYKLIFFNSDKYLEVVSGIYALRKEKDSKVKDTEVVVILQYLERYYEKVGISKSDVENAMSLLYSLFPKEKYIDENRDDYLLSVSNPSSFERYSFYRLLDYNLSENNFNDYRLKSLDEFCTKIKDWVNKELGWQLKKRFESINAYSDKDDFEKVIRAITFFARLPMTEIFFYTYNGFDFENLYGKLNNVDKYLRLEYYSKKEEYKAFVLEIFKGAPSPYLFDMEFIYRYMEGNPESDNFIITKEEFQEIRLNYFKKYLKTAQKFDSNVSSLYQFSELIDLKPHGNAYKLVRTKDPKATEMVIDFIKSKALNSFIFSIISVHRIHSEIFKVDSKLICDIFVDFDKFTNFLQTFKEENHKYLKEFKAFLAKLEEDEQNEYVEFDFKDIPVQTKQ